MTATEDAVQAALAVLGPLAQADAPLGALTTYRVGGRARVLVEAHRYDDLVVVREAVAASGLPVLVVGGGSNLLVADQGFVGVAVRLGPGFARLKVAGGHSVEAGGALRLPTLARRSVEAGLSGLEWAVGVPGSVGGAVRMNAGGHGSDVAATLSSCEVVDLAGPGGGVYEAERLHLGYRSSSLSASEVVVAATFALRPGDPAAGREAIQAIVRWRRQHQPGGSNAGSVFVNPPGDSAGRLVEAAGLKGTRHGTAVVSTKHANFIQADPGGSANDVAALVEQVRSVVAERFGVRLATEVVMVGFEEGAS